MRPTTPLLFVGLLLAAAVCSVSANDGNWREDMFFDDSPEVAEARSHYIPHSYFPPSDEYLSLKASGHFGSQSTPKRFRSLQAEDDDDQYEFLEELYHNTYGDRWLRNDNWLVRNDNTSLCDWYGIECAGGWVQKIELQSNGLGGPLPDRWERIPYVDRIEMSSNKYVSRSLKFFFFFLSLFLSLFFSLFLSLFLSFFFIPFFF